MFFKIAENLFTNLLGKPTPPLHEDGYKVWREDDGAKKPLKYKLLIDEPTLKVRRYESRKRKRSRIPVLLVPPLMITADVFDLHPKRSIVRSLLDRGFDVFLVDYGKPRRRDRNLSLSRYIEHRLHTAVRTVKTATGSQELSLVGYCLGGVFANCYAALHPRSGIRNLAVIGAPTDYSKLSFYQTLASVSRRPLEKLAEHYGYIPGPACNASFHLLHPDVVLKNPLKFIQSLRDPAYGDVVRKNGGRNLEYVNLTESAFKQLWTEVVIENRLHHDAFVVNGRTVNYGKIRSSFLVIAGKEDRLITTDCVFSVTAKLKKATDVTTKVVPGGHLGMLIGRRADKTWKTVGTWLETRSTKSKPVSRPKVVLPAAANVTSIAPRRSAKTVVEVPRRKAS